MWLILMHAYKMNLQQASWKCVKMEKCLKTSENQQNMAQNFLKSGNFLKILMPVDVIKVESS